MTGNHSRVQILRNTTHILLRLGFQAHQKGYRYLREAVLIVFQEPEALTSVTKLLYPEVAKRFNTTDKQVERAIRNSIETAWTKGNKKALGDNFGEIYINSATRPTNTEVIEILKDNVDKMPIL